MTRPPAPLGRPRTVSARRITLAALHAFAAQGFDETTMDDVAVAAGVSRTTVFRYLESKSAIVWDGFSEALDALATGLQQASSSTPWRSVVATSVIDSQCYALEDQDLLRLRLGLIDSVPTLRAHSALHARESAVLVAACIAARTGADAGDLGPMVWGHAVWSASFQGLTWWARTGSGSPEAAVRAGLATLGLVP